MAVLRKARPGIRRGKPWAKGGWWRFAKALKRIAKAALTDEDTYVFSGIACLGLGVGWVLGPGFGAIAVGMALAGFGVWLGYWRLSARPGGEE